MSERIGYFAKNVFFLNVVSLCLKRIWIWPPGLGAAGLQLLCGQVIFFLRVRGQLRKQNLHIFLTLFTYMKKRCIFC